MNARKRLLHLCTCFTIVTICCLAGCAQNTEAPVSQDTGQKTVTPSRTDQDAATQGSQVYTYIINAPGRGALANTQSFNLNTKDGISALVDKVLLADGTAIEGTDAGYAQSGITVNITTGGTAPSLTGTTSANAGVAQNPNANPTVSPVQDIKPEITASVPIGVALPGGMVDQQSLATGRGQTEGTDKTSENDLRWAKIEAAVDKLDALLPILESIFTAQPEPTPTTQPTT